MTKRTFSKALPSPGENRTWPEESDVQMGKIARNEANLTTMPFVRPESEDQTDPIRFEWTAIGRDGQPHDFFQVFRPGHDMRLPGPTADRVTMALLSMSPGPVDQNLRIRPTLDELASLCQLSKSGATYERIRKALTRLQGVTIETNAFWDHGRQKYMDRSVIELFSSHHLNVSSSQTEFDVRWTSDVADLMNSWSKPLNLGHLFQLDSCLARKLYQVSSLGIYQQGEMVEDLELLCHGHLGISQSREYPSELKRSLRGPIESLREKNLIDVTIEKDPESPSINSDWCVRARPMEGMLEVFEEIDDPQYWACHLAGRGMMDFADDPLGECREWVDEKGVDRVRNVVQEYDRRRSSESEATPVRHAGWIYHVLKNDVNLEGEDSGSSKNRSDNDMIY